MDFALSKKHEMARTLFKEFAENEESLLHRTWMKQTVPERNC